MEPGKLYRLLESKMLFTSKDKKGNILLTEDSIIMCIEVIPELENFCRINFLHKTKIGYMIFNKLVNPNKLLVQV